MSEFRVGVVGGAGRMGEELFHCIDEEVDLKPSVCVDRNTSRLYPQTTRLEDLDENTVDGLIDFSLPDLTAQSIEWASRTKKPLVIGTTGLEEKHFQAIKKASQHTAILQAPNMSLGVALMGEAMKLLASLKGFDFHINEFHHRHKKDIPSGTAIFLKDRLEAALDGQEIPEPTGIRGGGIFGVHQVFAMSDEEVITFEHQALNRRVFAKGAVRALRWLREKPPGCYGLTDLL